MLKYFDNDDLLTVDSLKKKYKKLAFMYHPDTKVNASQFEQAQSEKAMKDINNEYQQALQMVGQNVDKNYREDREYPDIIEKIIKLHMIDVTIEICGWFVYLSGNTKTYKTELKKLGLLWNSTKSMWYWKPHWWTRKGSQQWDMEKIRDVYGSDSVKQNFKKQRQLKA